MTIRIDRFPEFFRELNGHEPFDWQTRLCEHVMTTGRWPDAIDAPTGSGKSSVIDVHVFAVAAAVVGDAERVPRRLAITVDRRALVDGHHEHAVAIARKLREAETGILADVAHALRSLRGWCTVNEESEKKGTGTTVEPLIVGVLRGARRPSRDWLDDPAACQVIAATPDMLGSRLLFNGYGSTTAARPREAGLLAYDCAAVIDEAHLNRQLLTTLRRVHEFTARHAGELAVPALQVTAMTATPDVDDDAVVIGVNSDEVEREGVLRQRLTRPKPVRLQETTALPVGASSAAVRAAANEFVEQVLALSENAEGTIGCVVNTVRLALAITEQLGRATFPETHPTRAGEPVRVRQLVGRMRPYDVDRLKERHPLMFEHGGDPSVDVLVATQTVEVGLDMDFAGLVTELAPGSAIAQRAGRLNRSGRRESAPCVVIAPATSLDAKSKGLAPYRWEDLESAREWLAFRAADPDGLAPWSLHPTGGGNPPPPEKPRRPVFHRLEQWNIDLWSRTSQQLFAPIDLDLWLDDDLVADSNVSVVVRHGLPASAASAVQQLNDAPPMPHELFPARLREARSVLARVIEAQSDSDGAAKSSPNGGSAHREWAAFVLRGDETIIAGGLAGVAQAELRPGDLLVLDAGVKAFTPPIRDAREHSDSERTDGPVEDGAFTQQVFVEEGTATASDVAEMPGAAHSARRVGFRLSLQAPLLQELPRRQRERLLEDLREIVRDEETEDPTELIIDRLKTAAGQYAGGERWGAFEELLLGGGDARVVVTIAPGADAPEADPHDFWLVVSASASAASDDVLRQVTSPALAQVELDAHERAVGESANLLGRAIALPTECVDALGEAGLLHDEGKRDIRFQRSLRTNGRLSADGRALAKSGMRDLGVIRRARAASGLPLGWRHEQLSAAVAWEELSEAEPSFRDLVTRLTGTSHGHGRPLFDDDAASLIGEGRIVSGDPSNGLEAPGPGRLGGSELFDDAEWDELIARTHARWGYWGAAYLEAVLRAADVTVSRRGS